MTTHDVYLTATKNLATEFTDNQLYGLRQLLTDESNRRWRERTKVVQAIRAKARLAECSEALSHLFLNIAHAMACKMALRWVKGHPPVGKTATPGDCWTAFDGAEVERYYQAEICRGTQHLYTNPLRPFKSYEEAAFTLCHPLIKDTSSKWARSYSESF